MADLHLEAERQADAPLPIRRSRRQSTRATAPDVRDLNCWLGSGRLTAVVAQLGLVLDCHDPESLAAFWSRALGYELIGGAGSYLLLLPAGGAEGPQLLLQRAPEPKQMKNRMHFDIHVADIEAESSRLVDLGAERVQPEALSEHGNNWVLLQDPEGNEFCVCDGGSGA
jgi:predicted enzyme related to lactoylglutathione lyase